MTFHFADTVIAALGRPTKGVQSAERLKGVPELMDAARIFKNRMRSATRFVLDDDFVAFAQESCMRASATDLLTQYERFRLPHDNVWIEWDDIRRQHEIQRVSHDIGQPVMAPDWDAIAYRCGYLFHEDEYHNGYEKESVTANLFIGFDDEQKNVIGASPLALQFAVLSPDSGFTLEHHRRFFKDFTGRNPTDGELRDARKEEVVAASDNMGTWWCQRESKTDSKELNTILNHLRLVQGRGIAFFPHYHEPYTDESMAAISKCGIDMTRGDSRFLITVMALLNYDWVIKTPREGSGSKYRFGKFHKGNSHIEVAIDLPKWRGVTITPTEFKQMNESCRRQHSVRGHFRRYKSGRSVWVKPHVRGDAKLGIITKDYRLTHRSKR